MRYIAAEDVAKAKEMDLLTYLRNYEPLRISWQHCSLSWTAANSM